MKIKFFTLLFVLFSVFKIQAQENSDFQNVDNSEKKLYIKGNALFIPIGIVNAGLEYQLNQKFTMQGDILVSPWKSFAGHELQYYSLSLEGRYYFKEAFQGWFVGANIAASSFVLQKWNYWSDELFPSKNEEGVTFIKSNLYQKGYSVLFGATLGYQFKLSENWRMDIYGTVGSSQDFYKGYDRISGKRYDEKPDGYNRSGEILPYRGGIMISYRLK
ncbi:DUF3575 domain-containing protein [Chryseobacterium taihuense]|uniref:DUF3575 domain-containing protein n=1 Tax=Chryseobacterium taihuense TaxID=1141221 RepID=A0ABY0QSB3_9FLAO|nr:DUF3575 domain-containing protein [Chryseobacterium taihuense]SDL68953.1 Protein of unknown function [Chryseobacterium taihuense]